MNSRFGFPGNRRTQAMVRGWVTPFDYKVIQSQPLRVQRILLPVVRTSDTPRQMFLRIYFRFSKLCFTIGFSERAIRRELRRLFPDSQL